MLNFKSTTFTVEHHHLRLKPVWLNLRLKMRAPVLHHGANALQVFPQHGHFGARRGEVVVILLAQVGGDVAGDLRVEVNAIHHDDDCGTAKLRMQPQLRRGEDHEQRFAAALKMPGETFSDSLKPVPVCFLT